MGSGASTQAPQYRKDHHIGRKSISNIDLVHGDVLQQLRAHHGRDPEKVKAILSRALDEIVERGNGRTVLVTGANGFLASHIVAQLLVRGYTVRGTSRDPSNAAKCQHLRQLPGAEDRLTLLAGDLMADGAFDDAAQGCEAIIHTASPYFLSGDEEELCTPAFHGTLNVLKTAARVASVKRVVITSSMAAVAANGGQLPADHVYSSADWSEEEMLREKGKWYHLSKTLAERAAWNYMTQHEDADFTLATMCPTILLGPLLGDSLNESSNLLMSHIDGSKSVISNANIDICDVRDAAAAHIAVMEHPEVSARFLVNESSTPLRDFYELLKPLCPEAEFPTEVAEGEPTVPMKVDMTPLYELGWHPRELMETLKDTLRSLHAKGMYPPSARAHLPPPAVDY